MKNKRSGERSEEGREESIMGKRGDMNEEKEDKRLKKVRMTLLLV